MCKQLARVHATLCRSALCADFDPRKINVPPPPSVCSNWSRVTRLKGGHVVTVAERGTIVCELLGRQHPFSVSTERRPSPFGNDHRPRRHCPLRNSPALWHDSKRIKATVSRLRSFSLGENFGFPICRFRRNSKSVCGRLPFLWNPRRVTCTSNKWSLNAPMSV